MVNSGLDLVSLPEWELLEAIRELRFGEMFGVEVPHQEAWMDAKLTPHMHDLIQYLRGGVCYIDVLTVHSGQPVEAETDLKIGNFRCRKKVRFPTG